MGKTVTFLDKHNNIAEEVEIPDDQYEQIVLMAEEMGRDPDELIRETLEALIQMELNPTNVGS